MKNEIICVFGKKGSGKTEFVKKHIIPEYDRVLILDSLKEYEYLYFSNLYDFCEAVKSNLNRSFFRLVYRPMDENDDSFFRLAYSLWNITIIIEETDLFSGAIRGSEYFEKLIKYGRHRSINIVGISRRPAEVSKTIVSQADIIISFQQTLKRDIDFFRSYMDDPDILRNLKLYEYRVIQGNKFFS